MLTEAESTQLTQETPFFSQVKAENRDLDMKEWGKTADEWAVTMRKTRKEYADLKAEHEKVKTAPRGVMPLKPDSKPEEIAEYRKTFGVPEKPDGYQYKLADGMPADLLDAEGQKAFYERMHKHNASPAIVKEALDFEVERAVARRKAMADEQNAKAKALAEKLSTKYGEAAQSKVDAAMKFVEAFGSPELRKRIEDKDHPDPIGNDADVLDLLINAGALVTERGLMPGSSGTSAASAGPELKEVYSKSYRDGHMT